MKALHFGLVLLVAAVTCGGGGYLAGRASAQGPQPRLSERQYNATLPRDVYPDSRGRLPIVKSELPVRSRRSVRRI